MQLLFRAVFCFQVELLHNFLCPFLADNIAQFLQLIDFLLPLVPEVGKLFDIRLFDVAFGEAEVIQLKKLLMDLPELVEAEGETIAGDVSEHLSGIGDFEAVFVGLHELEIFEIFEKQSQVDKL